MVCIKTQRTPEMPPDVKGRHSGAWAASAKLCTVEKTSAQASLQLKK
jgi:hypothetical protein